MLVMTPTGREEKIREEERRGDRKEDRSEVIPCVRVRKQQEDLLILFAIIFNRASFSGVFGSSTHSILLHFANISTMYLNIWRSEYVCNNRYNIEKKGSKYRKDENNVHFFNDIISIFSAILLMSIILFLFLFISFCIFHFHFNFLFLLRLFQANLQQIKYTLIVSR